jgi:ADP-ribosylglycohydrolase
MKNIIRNSIYGFIIGDIIGVPYEFKIRKTFNCTDMRASTFYDAHSTLPLGSWSDDTSLMLSVLDALTLPDACKKEIYEKFRENAIGWMYHGKFTNHGDDIPYDIGNSCCAGITAMKLGRTNPKADKSVSNGGLMRILPLAFLPYEKDEEILDFIKLFNKDSHNSQISHIGCLIYIKFAQELVKISGKSAENALKSAINGISEAYKIPEYQRIWDLSIINADINTIKSSGYIVDTLEASIWSLMNSVSFEDAVLTAVNLGDDTDTVGAIAGGLAGIYYDDIPQRWIDNIRKIEIVDEIIKRCEGGIL